MNFNKEQVFTLITEIIKDQPNIVTVTKRIEFCNAEFSNLTVNDFTSNYLIKSNWTNKSAKLQKTKIDLINLNFSFNNISFNVTSLTNYDEIHKIGRLKTINNKILGFNFKKEIKYVDLYPQIKYKMGINGVVYDLDIEEFNFIMSCYYKSYELYDEREKVRINDQKEKELNEKVKELLTKYNI